MTTWFVSRHQGAIEWVKRYGPPVHRFVSHLCLDEIKPGDRVLGTLPVNLAAKVCRLGATYWHLALELPSDQRGQELSAETLKELGASLHRYIIYPAGEFYDHTNKLTG